VRAIKTERYGVFGKCGQKRKEWMEMAMTAFPKPFIWNDATAAHQIEVAYMKKKRGS